MAFSNFFELLHLYNTQKYFKIHKTFFLCVCVHNAHFRLL